MEREYVKIWNECLSLIQDKVAPGQFKIFFEPVRALKYKNDVLTIQVPTAYVYEKLEGEYIDILRNALRTVLGPQAKLEYSVIVVQEQKPRVKPLTRTIISAPSNKPATNVIYDTELKNPFQSAAPSHLQIDSNLNPSYTMDSYIEGPCNRLAKSAGYAIAQRPGATAFNPLLLYGGSGLGKTHLAQAIGWEAKRNFPNKVVLYVPTNLFQTQFTEAVRRNELNNFLHFYQLIYVLILDDIQELAGKEGTQRTFFHIFNHLHQSGKQLILTCDKSPAELEGMEERLLSRFRWGLSAEIKAPDFDTRKEIIVNKALKDGIDISDDIINYICKFADNNIRELEGVLISLLAQSTFNKCDLTLDIAKDILGKMVKKQTEELTIDKIQQIVCDHYNISLDLLQTKTRKREVVQARQLAMFLCKNFTNKSLAFIGSQIGKKDHATVLYACKAVTDLMETDRNFKMQVEEIQRKLV